MSVLIQPIDKHTVNQICSGQVVLTIATAVKELLENSIDAGADCIHIRLKEYGSELIEVSDNGCGVEESNFQALTLKHYTSKISDFSDLINVGTFGFRGEALSSLCSLSDVTIITRHKSVVFGTKLQMNHNGIIVAKSKTARQVGTTVILENIFKTLPVRHKEYLRNLKREFTKMCNVIYAYGIQACGVSISCSNQTSNKKLIVMETKGESVKSNITCIFGPKQAQNLLKVKEKSPDDEVLEEFSLKRERLPEKHLKMYHLEGQISSCSHGSGRSSTDRQYYYINSRPVDNPKITKLVNDVYHQYNPHQYPFVVLNIKVSSDSVDINVTPDKRQILLDNEKLMLATLKASLQDLYKNIPSTLPIQNTGVIKVMSVESNGASSWADKLQRFRSNNANTAATVSSSNNSANSVKYQPRLDSFVKSCPREIAVFKSDVLKVQESTNVPSEESVVDCNLGHVENQDTCLRGNGSESRNTVELKVPEIDGCDVSRQSEDKALIIQRDNKRKTEELKNAAVSDVEAKRPKIDEGITEFDKKNRKNISCCFSIEDVRKLIKTRKENKNTEDDRACSEIKFFSEINPHSNDQAENELKREISKDMFKKMEILGQFNLGFIITKLGKDLFIVDQHATDEKYNFETLQLTTVIQSQKLVIPQRLELTIDKEESMLEHADVIRKNGFDFSFDAEEPPTKRIKLTSIPLSKNWVFGKDDIDELLFMLEDSPNTVMCRPSRIRDMFASRACRKSVMIGTPLSHPQMRRLIDHMGDIEQPWNCPHGRPTIRHLLNLNMIHGQT